MFEAKVISDSICHGNRLTTMQLTHPRIIHAEFNTHCMFSRNASSSRAIPFATTVKRVIEDPFLPVFWGENQSGMQAAKEIADWKKEKAIKYWLGARDEMIKIASALSSKECLVCKGKKGWSSPTGGVSGGTWVKCQECQGTGEGINLHKQIVNRLIEPWAWITVCVTGDAGAWSNYFALRCDKDAQPEIQKQAYMAQKAYFESTPEILRAGDWHLPYIRQDEYADLTNWYLKNYGYADSFREFQKHAVKISVGRCARTSYLTQEGQRDFDKDVELHDRLCYHKPMHASPFEHVCQAQLGDSRFGKYIGWKAYRHMLPDEYVTNFKPNYQDKNNG